MSAFVVEKEHIIYLVKVALKSEDCSYFVERFGKNVDIAQMLWNENKKSVAYRYDEPFYESNDDFKPEDFDIEFSDYSPEQIIMSCRCYNYQSCEHPEWDNSVAKEFVNEIMLDVLYNLVDKDNKVWGYPKVI